MIVLRSWRCVHSGWMVFWFVVLVGGGLAWLGCVGGFCFAVFDVVGVLCLRCSFCSLLD